MEFEIGYVTWPGDRSSDFLVKFVDKETLVPQPVGVVMPYSPDQTIGDFEIAALEALKRRLSDLSE